MGTMGSVTFVASARFAGAALLDAGAAGEVAEPEPDADPDAEPDAEDEDESVVTQYWPLSLFEQTALWKGASM